MKFFIHYQWYKKWTRRNAAAVAENADRTVAL